MVDDPGNTFSPVAPGTTLHRITVPAGAVHARFSLFDDFTDGNDDLDLSVYRPNGSFAGGSGSGTSADQVDVADPVAGEWYVFVHGWQTDGPDPNDTLFSWAVEGDAGDTTLTAPSECHTRGVGHDRTVLHRPGPGDQAPRSAGPHRRCRQDQDDARVCQQPVIT